MKAKKGDKVKDGPHTGTITTISKGMAYIKWEVGIYPFPVKFLKPTGPGQWEEMEMPV